MRNYDFMLILVAICNLEVEDKTLNLEHSIAKPIFAAHCEQF